MITFHICLEYYKKFFEKRNSKLDFLSQSFCYFLSLSFEIYKIHTLYFIVIILKNSKVFLKKFFLAYILIMPGKNIQKFKSLIKDN
jgi:hypothetical protein